MPRSVRSQPHSAGLADRQPDDFTIDSSPPSPDSRRRRPSIAQPTAAGSNHRLRSARASEVDLRSRRPSRLLLNETSSLLSHADGGPRSYAGLLRSARSRASRLTANSGPMTPTYHHSRKSSWGGKIASAMGSSWRRGTAADDDEELKGAMHNEESFYDQFTSIDWTAASIADNFRVRDLRARRDFKGRLYAWLDGAQGWILAALVGIITACIAYFVDVTESAIFDVKEGYCTQSIFASKSRCCLGETSDCPLWRTWGDALQATGLERETIDLVVFVASVVLFSLASCALVLTTKTVVQSPFTVPTLDDNLNPDAAREHHRQPSLDSDGTEAESPDLPQDSDSDDSEDTADDLHTAAVGMTARPPDKTASPVRSRVQTPKVTVMPASAPKQHPPRIYYPAAGSGVAEVKVILSGFVVHGYLGMQTLVIKTLALILSVASGLSLGKEGPFVHIATCVGNISCRLFRKYNNNDGKRREVLSASAASGVAVAFGAPIAGVLFSLEEVSYYFPSKTLFRTFFCCIAAALSLKFLNPYGTGKIVIFEVRYVTDWQSFELIIFVLLGVVGGALGALFIKASKLWARTFRGIPIIKRMPLLEVGLVALVTGLLSFWNVFAKQAVTELLYELASPCTPAQQSTLCPKTTEEVKTVLGTLGIAFIIKAFLTTITFGIKVPAGIYVPSMVVGGLLGRMVGHLMQWCVFAYPNAAIFSSCAATVGPEGCITPGVYALIAAGATMCGVTRLSVTLPVILFELTGSLDHVLPFSLAVLVAKWTADAMEPLSIYDLLTEMNSYPFLDNRAQPIFTTELGDITPKLRRERIIDVTPSPLIPAHELRRKLQYVHNTGELDGGLPILRDRILVGLIPAPDLEYALDQLDNEDNTLCLMTTEGHFQVTEDDGAFDPTDFRRYIDPAPIALDIHSPMDLVYQCFVKLGLRFVCVSRDGRYAGMVHKKAFVQYMREIEHAAEDAKKS